MDVKARLKAGYSNASVLARVQEYVYDSKSIREFLVHGALIKCLLKEATPQLICY